MSVEDEGEDARSLYNIRKGIGRSLERSRSLLAGYRRAVGAQKRREPSSSAPRINARAVLHTLMALAPPARPEPDSEYFGRRALEEAEAAEKAACVEAKRIHTSLASVYRRLSASR